MKTKKNLSAWRSGRLVISLLICSLFHLQGFAQSTPAKAAIKPAAEKSQDDSAEEILLQARQKLDEAERLAAQIIESARLESQKIRHETGGEVSHSLDGLKQEHIAIEAQNKSLKEVLQMIMPDHWRVMLDVNESKFDQQRFDFIAQKPRDEMLADFTRSLGLTYQYFYLLKDESGQAKPLLVVAEQR